MKRKPDVGEERKKLVSLDNNEKMSGGHKASGRKRKSIEIPSLHLSETVFHAQMGEEHISHTRKKCNMDRTFQKVHISLQCDHLRWSEKSLSCALDEVTAESHRDCELFCPCKNYCICCFRRIR